ncbi:MAG: helix-turn-helix domain-containing protein [Anditalea sp.]
MKFETYIPCEILKPFVKSFAIQETVDETTYKVLPDTGLVIGFQYRGKLSRIENQTENTLSISGVSGLADHSRLFKNSPDIGTVFIFFNDGGATPFFKHPLHELFRESVSLDNFMLRSELLCLEEQLAEATSDISRITAVEKFLIRRMIKAEPDKLVLAAVALIHKSKGNIRIKELLEPLHISQSPLEKRFRQTVGASPKKFASIVRLKHVLQQYNTSTSLTELGYEAGFYDQAHFIKEFTSFTGDTPENFFADKK